MNIEDIFQILRSVNWPVGKVVSTHLGREIEGLFCEFTTIPQKAEIESFIQIRLLVLFNMWQIGVKMLR